MAPPATHLTVFGVPHISRDGREVAMPVRKALALFVFLALEGRSSRARLAAMFWSGLDEPTGRRNLRHALHRLRAAGLGDVLVADDEHVALAGVGNDLQAFDQAVAEGRLDAAHGLRTGPLLDRLEVEDAPEFDDWLRGRREQFLRTWRSAMSRHAGQLESGGDLRAALAVHRGLLDDDALQEAAYRDLMRLHDALGERAAALELFDRCERTLRDELGLEPLPETRLLVERIRARPSQAAGGIPAAPAEVADRDVLAPRLDLRTVPLVARERELAAAAALRTSLVLVEGEAGVGKSRLAVELARHAGPASALDEDLLIVRFSEMSSSTPFYAVADALRSVASVRRLATLDPVWKQDITRLLPEIRIEAEPFAEDSAPTPAEARTRLLEALAQALALAAGPARTLVLDDLQWADPSSLELLAHLARRHRHAPAQMARVLATARSAELSDNPHAGIALQAIASDGNLARLRLEAFDEWSMLQLIQRLSGSAGGARFAARLLGATGGNVFFALETIRALFESGELRLDPTEGWSTRYDDTTTDYAELPLPTSVVEAVRSRIARLGAATQRLLETAALAEDGSTLAEIHGATALSEWEALEGIERAVAGHVVDRSGDGYRFVHDLFRTALRSGLSPERQRLTHAKLAAALEPLHASPARIAAHWQQAGQADSAVKAWRRAAEAAIAVHAHREAIEHYRQASELVDDEASAVDLLDLRLERMRLANLTEGREALLAQLIARAQRTGSRTLQFRAMSRAATFAADERRMDAAERYAMRAVREFDPPTAAQHLYTLGLAAFAAEFLDRPNDALDRYLEALAVATRAGEPRGRAAMAAFAARAAVNLDRVEQASELAEAALLASAADPGTVERGQVLGRVAFVSRAQGQRGKAVAQLEEAVSIARTTRMKLFLVAFLATLCEVLIDDGQFDAARAACRECTDACAGAPQPFLRYLSTLASAGVFEAHGELGAALAAGRAAVDASEALESLTDQRESRLLHAGLLLRIGATEESLRAADEADRRIAADRQGVVLLSENLRASADLARDPAGVKARLEQALSLPLIDRPLHPRLQAARVLLGRAELALGRPQAAREAADTPTYSVSLEAGALAVRLAASGAEGRVDHALLTEATALLDGGRLPPLQALALMRDLDAAEHRAGGGQAARRRWRRRMKATAQALADSLGREPPLQAAFIRKHRDLLT